LYVSYAKTEKNTAATCNITTYLGLTAVSTVKCTNNYIDELHRLVNQIGRVKT